MDRRRNVKILIIGENMKISDRIHNFLPKALDRMNKPKDCIWDSLKIIGRVKGSDIDLNVINNGEFVALLQNMYNFIKAVEYEENEFYHNFENKEDIENYVIYCIEAIIDFKVRDELLTPIGGEYFGLNLEDGKVKIISYVMRKKEQKRIWDDPGKYLYVDMKNVTLYQILKQIQSVYFTKSILADIVGMSWDKWIEYLSVAEIIEYDENHPAKAWDIANVPTIETDSECLFYKKHSKAWDIANELEKIGESLGCSIEGSYGGKKSQKELNYTRICQLSVPERESLEYDGSEDVYLDDTRYFNNKIMEIEHKINKNCLNFQVDISTTIKDVGQDDYEYEVRVAMMNNDNDWPMIVIADVVNNRNVDTEDEFNIIEEKFYEQIYQKIVNEISEKWSAKWNKMLLK